MSFNSYNTPYDFTAGEIEAQKNLATWPRLQNGGVGTGISNPGSLDSRVHPGNQYARLEICLHKCVRKKQPKRIESIGPDVSNTIEHGATIKQPRQTYMSRHRKKSKIHHW